jgi:radical SAM superfamily enzyme YgiQ (UPF0313 family)
MRVCLVVYDNESYIHWFPIGLAYIGAILRQSGYEVVVYSQDVNHWADEHLTEYLNENEFDIVCYSTIGGYYQYKKLLNISKAINDVKKRPVYIIGGHGPTPEPEYFLKKTHADYVVMGEGEETVIELFEAIASKQSVASIKGIAYRVGHETYVNPRRDTIKDIDQLPLPAYDLFPIDYYRLLRMPNCESTDFIMPIISGRGCPFRCNFCYRMDEGFRIRSVESIIEEIQFLKAEYGITYIAFGDELLMSSEKRTEELCNGFIRERLNVKWDCNGRLNYAKAPILKLMKEAGCVFINYGIESVDDSTLRVMKKGLTVKQIERGIEATLQVGISPGFNIIFGNIDEDLNTLQKGVEFLLKYDDHSQLRNIRPVTPYPGSDLYYYAIEKGLLAGCEDFYENKHKNSDLMAVNFTRLSDEDFYRSLYDANMTLFNNYYDTLKLKNEKVMRSLYLELDDSFRGFRHT